MDLQKHMFAFLDAKRAGNRAKVTVDWYKFMFDAYTNFAGESGYSDNDLLTEECINEFLTYRAGLGLAENTVLGHYRALRALFRWLERRGKLEVEINPFDLIDEPKVADLLPKAISRSDVLRLSLSIRGDTWRDVRDRMVIEMLFCTGLRVSELASIKLNDIDLEQRRIQVYRHKTRAEGFVPVARSLATALQHWIEEVRPEVDGCDALFISKRQGESLRAITSNGIQQMIERRCQYAGMKVYRAHCFRHGCAVQIIRAGGDISLVQRVLGHKDTRSSMVYLRFDDAGVLALYDKIFD